MVASNLLEKIRLDKYYQVGVILSFLVFMASISIEPKFLNNSILALFSSSFLFFFLGVWMSMGKSFEQNMGVRITYTSLKKTKFGTSAFSISSLLFVLGLLNLYKFFN